MNLNLQNKKKQWLETHATNLGEGDTLEKGGGERERGQGEEGRERNRRRGRERERERTYQIF